MQDDLYRILNKLPLQKEKEFLFRSHQLDDTIFFLWRENIDACINTVIKYQLGNGNYETFALSKEIENPVNLCYGENYHGIIMIKSLLGWEEAGSLKSHGETQYNKIHLPDK